MTGLVRLHTGIQKSTAKTHVTNNIKKFMPSALIWKTEDKIAEIALRGHRKSGLAETAGEQIKFSSPTGFSTITMAFSTSPPFTIPNRDRSQIS